MFCRSAVAVFLYAYYTKWQIPWLTACWSPSTDVSMHQSFEMQSGWAVLYKTTGDTSSNWGLEIAIRGSCCVDRSSTTRSTYIQPKDGRRWSKKMRRTTSWKYCILVAVCLHGITSSNAQVTTPRTGVPSERTWSALAKFTYHFSFHVLKYLIFLTQTAFRADGIVISLSIIKCVRQNL